MKKAILFLILAFFAIQSSAQCVTNQYGTISVTVCNDGGIPSLAVTATPDGYRVTYDPTGVDYSSPGSVAYIRDLDGYRCTNCIAHVSNYGYCGSTQGVAMISFTCQMNPYVYTLYPQGVTHNLQLVLFMGKDAQGAMHFRYQTFKVTDTTAAPPPVPITTTIPKPGKGRGR